MDSSLSKMLVEMKMIEEGIAPFSSYFYGPDQSGHEALASLSPEEQRKAKRKFRKMWKKAYRALRIQTNMRGTKPTTSEACRRRAAVYRMVMSELKG